MAMQDVHTSLHTVTHRLLDPTQKHDARTRGPRPLTNLNARWKATISTKVDGMSQATYLRLAVSLSIATFCESLEIEVRRGLRGIHARVMGLRGYFLPIVSDKVMGRETSVLLRWSSLCSELGIENAVGEEWGKKMREGYRYQDQTPVYLQQSMYR